MSHDLFDANSHAAGPRPRQSSLVLVSALVHAGIIAALVVASMLVPGVLPSPHASTIWEVTHPVRLADIQLTSTPPRSVKRSAVPPTSDQPPARPVPVQPADGIHPESDQQGNPFVAAAEPGVPGVATSAGDLPGSVLPSPPPPAADRAVPVRLHSGIDAPRKIRDVVPAYPAVARTAGAQGVVIIEATIDARGEVVAARVLRSVPMLDDAAIEAVRHWRYAPARLNGEPVAVLITVTVNFTLAAR